MQIPSLPKTELEKYSSAVSLSDMEIFVFPELLYALVLANLTSPRIWAWREDPWFRKLDSMKPMRKIQRLKQFIIDRYEFNLDLDTWGLTTKERETARFAPFMDEATIARSNALFGYEGDKHYFSLDIRRHFGLDRYDSTVVPYWKTETVEAMDAFRFKENYRAGAGECVSLATLYAAALFIVCDVPLEDVFLMATPLHSQNFVDLGAGILTNNRRLVTKRMWFNGTDLTAKAQRALRNEQVTLVANNTGYVHVVYPDATMNPAHLDRFRRRLDAFTTTEITFEILANFLRDRSEFQSCFQIEYLRHGKPQYLPVERAYAYEHGSPYKVSDDATREKLLDQIDEYDFYADPIPGRIQLTRLCDFFKGDAISHFDKSRLAELAKRLECINDMDRKIAMLGALVDFVHLEPELPDPSTKRFSGPGSIEIHPGATREEIIEYLGERRATHPVADLSFYAARDLSATDPRPFLKAALERNPVGIEAAKRMDDAQVFRALLDLPGESIYDGTRAAQPDEVWNFRRGDGFERAVALAAILRARRPDDALELETDGRVCVLRAENEEYLFPGSKGPAQTLSLHP